MDLEKKYNCKEVEDRTHNIELDIKILELINKFQTQLNPDLLVHTIALNFKTNINKGIRTFQEFYLNPNTKKIRFYRVGLLKDYLKFDYNSLKNKEGLRVRFKNFIWEEICQKLTNIEDKTTNTTNFKDPIVINSREGIAKFSHHLKEALYSSNVQEELKEIPNWFYQRVLLDESVLEEIKIELEKINSSQIEINFIFEKEWDWKKNSYKFFNKYVSVYHFHIIAIIRELFNLTLEIVKHIIDNNISPVRHIDFAPGLYTPPSYIIYSVSCSDNFNYFIEHNLRRLIIQPRKPKYSSKQCNILPGINIISKVALVKFKRKIT
mmetsp:Transcript_10962/g.16105  ORF Transcript_10962/g.16105 Transcript_10962/m.16105 type:complete len:322 (+) Transcript_10962:112-1077(+)